MNTKTYLKCVCTINLITMALCYNNDNIKGIVFNGFLAVTMALISLDL